MAVDLLNLQLLRDPVGGKLVTDGTPARPLAGLTTHGLGPRDLGGPLLVVGPVVGKVLEGPSRAPYRYGTASLQTRDRLAAAGRKTGHRRQPAPRTRGEDRAQGAKAIQSSCHTWHTRAVRNTPVSRCQPRLLAFVGVLRYRVTCDTIGAGSNPIRGAAPCRAGGAAAALRPDRDSRRTASEPHAGARSFEHHPGACFLRPRSGVLHRTASQAGFGPCRKRLRGPNGPRASRVRRGGRTRVGDQAAARIARRPSTGSGSGPARAHGRQARSHSSAAASRSLTRQCRVRTATTLWPAVRRYG